MKRWVDPKGLGGGGYLQKRTIVNYSLLYSTIIL